MLASGNLEAAEMLKAHMISSRKYAGQDIVKEWIGKVKPVEKVEVKKDVKKSKG